MGAVVIGSSHVESGTKQQRDEPEGIDKGLSHLTRSISAQAIVLIIFYASQIFNTWVQLGPISSSSW